MNVRRDEVVVILVYHSAIATQDAIAEQLHFLSDIPLAWRLNSQSL